MDDDVRKQALSFRDCEIPELWNHSRNGTYAILATRLLRANPHLSKTSLWREIQQAVRREVGDEPARTNQGGPTLAYQLWHLGLNRGRVGMSIGHELTPAEHAAGE